MILTVFNRQRNILDYTLGSLWRHKFKNGGVFLVFSMVIFIIASFRLVTTSLENSSDTLLKSVPDIIVQKMRAGRQDILKLEERGSLDQIFGIKTITPRVWGYYFDETSGANYTVFGIPRDKWLHTFPDILRDSGEGLSLKRGVSAAVIGHAVRKHKNLEDRRSFSLFRPDLSLKSFYSVATFPSNYEVITADLIVMDMEGAQDLFGMHKSEVTDLALEVGNPAEIEKIAQKISESIAGSRVITKSQLHKTYRAAFGWRSGFGLVCLLGSIAAFIVLAWDKATGLSEEQRREVAILKAIGWHTTDILTIRFWESVLISGAAFIAGGLAAWIHVLWFEGYLFMPVLLGWSIIRPSLVFVPALHLADVMLILSISVMPYLAATVIPAWRSAVIRPESIV